MRTPAQVARLANVTSQSIRNYSRQYAALLSPRASGETGPRLYCDEDVEILCTIAALRKSGIPPGEIVEYMRAHPIPVVDVTPQSPSNMPGEGSNPGQEALFALQLVQPTINGRFDAIERHMEACVTDLRAEMRSRRKLDTLWHIGLGLWLGMVLMAALFFGVWLAVNGA